jgi:outer membrane protein TolC
MKSNCLYSIGKRITISFLGVIPLWAEENVTSLNRCIEKALSDNAALMLAQDELGLARARQRVATVAVLPSITGKLDETRGKADNSGDENQDFLERSYGVQATQSIFAGGKVWGTRRQASLATEIAALCNWKNSASTSGTP